MHTLADAFSVAVFTLGLIAFAYGLLGAAWGLAAIWADALRKRRR